MQLVVARSRARVRPPSTSTTTTARPGGSFTVPPPHDVEACEHALGGNGEFVVDVHTHHVMPDGPWTKNAPDTVQLVLGMVPACGASNRLECASRAAYLHDLFLASDTTVAMLSDVPNSGAADAPVPFLDQLGTQQLAAQLTHGGAPRVLVHNVIAPNFGDLNARLDEMEATAHTGKVAAFKVYTAWGPNGRGFALDDPAIGLPVIQKAHDLGVKMLIAHKGLPLVRFDAAHNRPDDIVAVSRQFPDMQFVVFHGAWDKNHAEGPYDPNATIGIDTFLRALDVHSVPPNNNVWVDVGTVWREVLRNPDDGRAHARQAAEARRRAPGAVGHRRDLVRLAAGAAAGVPRVHDLARVPGPLRLSRATPAIKAQVLGLNAAQAVRSRRRRHALRARDRPDHGRPHDGRAPARRRRAARGSRPNGPTTRREMLQWLASPATRWTPL